MADCDILVIGAGHNALVCAGYLAQAGYKVIMFERRHTVGGAVVTEEIVPGFKFDLGGSAHILIHHTPIIQDLDLARYGLEYIDIDPLFWAPFPDGSHFTIWKDLDKTCDSIAAISPVDADHYRAFVQRWEPLAEGMVRSFLAAPTRPESGAQSGHEDRVRWRSLRAAERCTARLWPGAAPDRSSTHAFRRSSAGWPPNPVRRRESQCPRPSRSGTPCTTRAA